jgi:hypothetical protein
VQPRSHVATTTAATISTHTEKTDGPVAVTPVGSTTSTKRLTPDELLTAVRLHWQDKHPVVYTRYHNPYECDFRCAQLRLVTPADDRERVVIQGCGYAKRIK